MNRDTLLALAERCEQSKDGCRELDAAIAATLKIGRNLPDWALNWGGEWKPTIHGHVALMQDDGKPGPSFSSLTYTASLEAALTLIPKGKSWSIEDPANADGSRSVFGYPSRCVAHVEGSASVHDYAVTPALAICTAALRSLARAGDA